MPRSGLVTTLMTKPSKFKYGACGESHKVSPFQGYVIRFSDFKSAPGKFRVPDKCMSDSHSGKGYGYVTTCGKIEECPNRTYLFPRKIEAMLCKVPFQIEPLKDEIRCLAVLPYLGNRYSGKHLIRA
jgi:hypothetical protein